VRTRRSSVSGFVVLLFALSIPFWLLGSVFETELLPGLPISSLAAFTPGIAAVLMVYGSDRLPGVGSLLRRSIDADRIGDKRWYLVFVLFNPAVAIMAYGLLRASDIAVPRPSISLLASGALFVAFFVAALGEEIGWTGYSTEPLLHRWGVVRTGLFLGLVWAVFHFVLLAQAGRPLKWMAWWSLGTVSFRAVMVWLYRQAGDSVFAAALFHALINLCWQLFPVDGSFYDPRIFSTATLALAVLLVAGHRLVARTRTPAA
jgi:membrane protease YdiL (CAAX protease family)